MIIFEASTNDLISLLIFIIMNDSSAAQYCTMIMNISKGSCDILPLGISVKRLHVFTLTSSDTIMFILWFLFFNHLLITS